MTAIHNIYTKHYSLQNIFTLTPNLHFTWFYSTKLHSLPSFVSTPIYTACGSAQRQSTEVL